MKKAAIKIAIVGHGFVGKATDWGFNKNVEKFIVDPIYKTTTQDLQDFQPAFVFVCVPTPMGSDGYQDSEIIKSVVVDLEKFVPDSIVIVKSTVLPSILEELILLNKNLIYNPEFLREKHANYDFENSQMIIFGGDRNLSTKASNLYRDHSRCINQEYIYVDLLSASLIKYSINTFLASKVIFFNELYQIFNNLGTNDTWEKIVSTISLDSRIGNSHMDVPGHDGRFGFGGACFPKDSMALAKYAKEINSSLSVLEAAIVKNNEIRSKYSELDQREKDQNVFFDGKI